jgi:hypothetical protein
MTSLQCGESREATIDARKLWNETCIRLEGGSRYSLAVLGEQYWFDASTRTDAGGYESSRLAPFRRMRRIPGAAWFSLIGTIDRDLSVSCVIGKGIEWIAPTSGELVCFANDVWFMYWNNRGSLRLVVERLK